MAVGCLPLLVSSYLGQSFLVRRRVVLDGDLRCHPAHGMDVSPMTRLDTEQRIRMHEMCRHRYLCAISEDKIALVPKLLDAAEDVVPTSAIEPGRVFTQLVQNFVHFESGRNGFD